MLRVYYLVWASIAGVFCSPISIYDPRNPVVSYNCLKVSLS